MNGPSLPNSFGALHLRSHFSFLRGASSPEELAAVAKHLGHTFMCVTDWMGVYSAVRTQRACSQSGLKPIVGAEVVLGVDESTVATVNFANTSLILICKNAAGYANLCSMLTDVHQRDREQPLVTMTDLRRCKHDVVCLTAGRDGHLWKLVHTRKHEAASAWLQELRDVFGENLYVELVHYRRPQDSVTADRMHTLATELGIRCVIGSDVRYACADNYLVYDVFTCTLKGISVFDHDAERPVNDEQCLKSQHELQTLLPYPDAFANTARVAAECSFDILPGHITPPGAQLPDGIDAPAVLRELCSMAFTKRYKSAELAPTQAALLEKELLVIEDLDLCDFFLVVREVVQAARQRGIRCSGRGSAANSIVSYLLEITGVDPVAHKLLFERFLHHGREGTPDIDVDFDSDRRSEVIEWMEERFGIEQTAMTANIMTYGFRMAVRDAAKALGWPNDVVNQMSKAMPGYMTKSIAECRIELAAVVGDSPLLQTLLEVVVAILGRPRHLGLHSGGMILSSRPLHHLTPVQISANAVKVAQFDKDDVEAMGLVKFDVLGLRMLACISEAVELVERYEGKHLELDELSLTDVEVYKLMCSGHTIGVFQIESQGQMHLLAQHQPEVFGDLVSEVALFRPGPLQSGTLNPYVRRRRGKEPTTFIHPMLEPILGDTHGIIVYQEQVLEIAHKVGNMSLREADEFRSIISKNRNPEAIERMKARFMQGAAELGVDAESAKRICDQLAHFTGFGFCRSHAAALAKTVYQSAWLKLYHPAAYMAAFMQHRPGFYNLMTLEQEARRLGVPILLPDINASHIRYELERTDRGLAIRKPLTSITGCTADVAKTITWARLMGEFTSVEDVVRRVDVHSDVLEAMALSGAMDCITDNARKALWEVGVGMRRKSKAGSRAVGGSGNASGSRSDENLLFDLPLISAEDVPPLPAMKAQERLAYDYRTHGAARIHPMVLYRRSLTDMGIHPVSTCYKLNNTVFTTAGIVILRQAPPTAKGFLFVTLEDESGFVQCIVHPSMRERFNRELRNAALIVKGTLGGINNWRGIQVFDVRSLKGVIGGYYGHPAMNGDTDTMELQIEEYDAIAKHHRN